MRALFFVGLFVVTSSPSWAQEVTMDAPDLSGQTWSAVGPKTVVTGANVLEASVGYPSISVGYLRGVTSGVNVGGRVGFLYGMEGMLGDAAPGLKVQALVKMRLLDSGRVSLGFTLEPGLLYYASFLQGARVGLCLPLGLRLGITASSALSAVVLIELPAWVEFGTFGGFNLPILTGAGVEYFITSQLAAFFRARVGPTIRTGGRTTAVTLESSLGVGYRF